MQHLIALYTYLQPVALSMSADVPQFPRIVDCFPPLAAFPGCSVPHPVEVQSSSLSYPIIHSDFGSHDQSMGPSQPVIFPSPSDDEDIAIPSGMPPSTRQSDLPTIPPPPQYWRLKKLDPSANVMDYWVKSSQQWDIDGIESDIAVSMEESSR